MKILPRRIFLKIHQRALSIFKNASNQKTDATLKNQLSKIYNFVSWPKKIRPLQRSQNGTLSLLGMAQPRYRTSNVQHSILRLSQTETKCNFTTFGVEWTNLFRPSNKVVYLKKLVFDRELAKRVLQVTKLIIIMIIIIIII